VSLLFLADDYNRQRSSGKESLTTSDPTVLSMPSSDSDPGNKSSRQMRLSIFPYLRLLRLQSCLQSLFVFHLSDKINLYMRLFQLSFDHASCGGYLNFWTTPLNDNVIIDLLPSRCKGTDNPRRSNDAFLF
jgi:hypothetical protein